VVDVACVGTFGRHLSDYRQINTLPPGTCFLASSLDPTTGKPLSDGFLRPYSGYTNIPMQYFDVTSSYDLQTQVTHRFRHSLQFGGVWTRSKTMGYTDSYDGTLASYANIRVYNYGESSEDTISPSTGSGIFRHRPGIPSRCTPSSAIGRSPASRRL